MSESSPTLNSVIKDMPRIADFTENKQPDGDEQLFYTKNGTTEGLIKRKVFPYEIQTESATNIFPSFESTHNTVVIGDFTSGWDGADFSGVYSSVNTYGVSSGNIDTIIAVGDVSDDIAGQSVTDLCAAAGANFNTRPVYDFISAAGNHDYDSGGITAFKSFFGIGDTYFTRTFGDVEFIFLDSNGDHPDNDTASAAAFEASTMGQWAINALDASTAPWKVLVFHHPPYSSGSAHGSNAYMQVDWGGYGAHAVLCGHEHLYERLHVDNTVYLTVGVAGGTRRSYSTQLSSSQAIFTGADSVGYLRLFSNPNNLIFEWVESNGSTVLDKVRLARIG